MTVLLDDDGSREVAKQVKQASRESYAITYKLDKKVENVKPKKKPKTRDYGQNN